MTPRPARRRTRCRFHRHPALWVLLAAIAAGGCHSAPRAYNDLDLSTPQAVQIAAAEHWHATGSDITNLLPAEPATIAVLEFNVQYVKETLRSVVGRQQAVAGAHEFSMVGGGLNIIGIGRHQIRFDEELRRNLPAEMYALFVEQLEAAGHRVLSIEAVTAAPAYAMVEPARPGSGEVLMLLNLFGGDTGRVKQFEIWPAEGLAAIRNVRGASMSDLQRAVLEQTGADVVLRAQFRVGTFDAYAAVEGDSIIEMASRCDASGSVSHGQVKSARSLVGDQPVVTSRQFHLLRGDVHTVDSDALRQALRHIFPAYAHLGLARLTP
jgi:hypothetical protein